MGHGSLPSNIIKHIRGKDFILIENDIIGELGTWLLSAERELVLYTFIV